ncbi:DUF2970 domain-containing protein [Piscinibacter sp. Jin2]|uniref:DUF2970 domain-containing protein n=1 Tax=Aquariibacter lacus TaxID=2801332 RepID=A0A9X0XBM0_9BURK|nr:DUF2970 domain-containing protein [Piscinibacter lacus]MBL0719202.1 DUF2970 domain-containing protein [Piscinibacter lacus]
MRAAAQRRGSFVQTAKAVAWSFFGVRRSKDQEQDLSTINPLHVIVAGIVGGLIFVIALVVLVRAIVGSGAAA